MKLPKPDQRVMVTGLFAGLFSSHVCVLPDATDEEILAVCNEEDPQSTPWTTVIRTRKDVGRLGLKPGDASGGLPGPCVECPGRIHMVVR